MKLITLPVLVTVYFFLVLLVLWWSVRNLRRSLKRSAKIIRQQRKQDLRWHRESLLAYIRAELVKQR
jgi:hypothetical protein